MAKKPDVFYNSSRERLESLNKKYVIQHDTSSLAGKSGSMHMHDILTIEFITNKSAEHVINGKLYECHKGCLYLFTPIDMHQFTNIEQGFEGYLLSFLPELIQNRFDDKITYEKSPYFAVLNDESYNKVFFMFRNIMNEYEKCGEFENIIVESSVSIIIAELFKNLIRDAKTLTTYGRSDVLLRQAFRYVRENFTQKIFVSDIASELKISESHFCRYFKEKVGVTFSKYVLNMRLDYAKNLILTSNLNMTEVCYECGIESISYFTKKFKEKFGYSPLQFRKTT